MSDARSDFEEATRAAMKREEKEPHLDIARPQEKGAALGPSVSEFQAESLKSSVAAHQATCSCHPAFRAVGEAPCCDRWSVPDVKMRVGKPIEVEVSTDVDARDSSSQPWHIDPLCKVRPEARA